MTKATAARTTKPGSAGGAESASAATTPKTKSTKTTLKARSADTGATTKATAKVRPTAAKGKPKPKSKPKPKTSPKPTAKTATTATEADGSRSDGSMADSDADGFFRDQRQALLAEREAYTRSASSLRAEAEQLAQDREPGDVQFDEESGEGDSMNVERERDLVLSAQAMASIEEIDRALAKIDQGTYGICDRCGEAIPRERMRALPHAALCVKCKSGGLSRR